MVTLPNDVLLDIPEFIDDPKDLLAFALTARIFYHAIVPKHIDYRRISCNRSVNAVWEHLSESPHTRHVRSLNIMDYYYPTRIPRVCAAAVAQRQTTDHRVGQVDFDLDTFVRALSKMTNLKVLRFSINGSNEQAIYTILRALGEAGCQLEELETQFRLLPNTGAIKGSQDCLIFYKHWPSLKKYILTPRGEESIELGLQMLLNASNLTHMYTNFVSPSILLAYWPNLEHLTIRSPSAITLRENITETEYLSRLQTFFGRHSKLITLLTHTLIILGWTIESDDFLPNLKSLGFAFPFIAKADINPGRVISSSMAASLTYLDMSDCLLSLLKESNTTLSGLDSCCYWAAEPEESTIRDLSEIIPNITKLCVTFRQYPSRYVLQAEKAHTRLNGFSTNVRKRLTVDEMLELSTILLTSFKHLKVLFGPFDELDIASEDYSIPEVLYNSPSLLYTRARKEEGTACLLFRLMRDSVAEKTTYEYEYDHPSECDTKSWSKFYTCTPLCDGQTKMPLGSLGLGVASKNISAMNPLADKEANITQAIFISIIAPLKQLEYNIEHQLMYIIPGSCHCVAMSDPPSVIPKPLPS